MTAREVDMCLRNMSNRMRQELDINAKLHGAEIKDNSVDKVAISKDNDDILTKHFEKMNKERFGK